MERLQKILSDHAVCSRRQAERWILQGRILVNGKPAELGQRADPEQDEITVDGQALGRAPAQVYVLLHKPQVCDNPSAALIAQGRHIAPRLM